MRTAARLLAACLLALCLCAQALAAPQGERRVALVIGNGAYREGPLKNPANDARDMAAVLKSLGFEVTLRENATRRAMNEAIDAFWQSLRKGGTGLFFFAGHGLQVAGENYLVPVDAAIRVERDVQEECVSASRVLGRMENAGNSMNIVILDACRNNPFARAFRSADRGLAKMDAPTGSLVAFATAPGDVAADGEGKNGLYTSHLLKHLRTPGLKVEDVLKLTRIGVAADSARLGRKQTPWESSSLMGDFYFARGAGQAAAPVQPPAPIQTASLPGQQALPAPAAAPPPPQAMAPAPKQAPQPVAPRAGDTWTEPLTGMEFIWVPGGEFEMGCGPWAGSGGLFGGCGGDEKPVHKVRLDGFWIGKYEVTQEQWQKVMRFNPSRSRQGPSYPVETVSWDEASEFASQLSAQGGAKLALPTEAQWEYAARSGGKPEKFSGGNIAARVAWFAENSGGGTHPVGQLAPNGLGIHDMSGNVWEWCQDAYSDRAYASHARNNPVNAGGLGPKRVMRGGGWNYGESRIRTTFRDSLAPDARTGSAFGGDDKLAVGLRLVRMAPVPQQQEPAPRAWLGLEMAEVTPEAAKASGLTTSGGVHVVRTSPGSPAAATGLQPGDIILLLDGRSLDAPNTLRLKVIGSEPGTTLRLGYWRQGRMHEATATLAAPQAQGQGHSSTQASQQAAQAMQQELAGVFGQPAQAQRFRGSLEGTRWTTRCSIPETPTEMEFLPGGVLRYVELGNSIDRGATWRQSGNAVTITINDWAVYTGTVSGQAISGTAKNPKASWTWTGRLAQ